MTVPKRMRIMLDSDELQARRTPLAQEDYFYEIQLTNKQLVFYFMAGASFLVLSFLAGIVVGRGVDASADTAVTRLAQEDKIIAEEPPPSSGKSAAPADVDLGYSPRLEADKPLEHRLEKAKAQASVSMPPIVVEAPSNKSGAPRSGGSRSDPGGEAPKKEAAKPAPVSPKPAATTAPGPASGGFAIQVGAFKDRASADSLVGRLKSKGYAAYAETNAGGLFNVRVGSFPARGTAEKVEARLRDEEKFKPFIVRQ